MKNLINIDSSTANCSVALAVNGALIFEKEERNSARHAALLGQFVAEAMAFAKSNAIKIEAVAVCGGPGSYTGLRIGVSEAKGLCFGLDVPLIAVSSLAVMTKQVIDAGYEADFFVPMLDARRMEVYTAVYDRQLRPLQEASAMILSEDSFSDYLSKGKVLFFGDGSVKCQSIMHASNAAFIADIYPHAAAMIPLSTEAFDAGRFEDTAYFVPFYLKEFVATIPKNKVFQSGF